MMIDKISGFESTYLNVAEQLTLNAACLLRDSYLLKVFPYIRLLK